MLKKVSMLPPRKLKIYKKIKGGQGKEFSYNIYNNIYDTKLK